MLRWAWLASLILAALGMTNCAHAPSTKHSIQNVIPAYLRVRRPVGPGADPKAGPGGLDYQSHPLPNAQLDCESVRSLFADRDLFKIRACLNSLQEPLEVLYELRREDEPVLRLLRGETTPQCLQEYLPEIRVPREIIFRSQDKGESHCYAARLEIEANRVLGIRLPTNRVNLSVQLPLEYALKTDQETLRLLGGWALTPLWEGKNRMLESKILPDRLCAQCLGEHWKDIPFADGVTWPE